MKSLLSILILTLAITSCKSEATHMIRDDLSSRFTGYEIVEIRKDSSFIDDAMNILNSLKIKVSENSLEIIKTVADFEAGKLKMNGLQVSQHIDSAYNDSEERLQSFEDRKFERSEPCYYVKYRIFDGAKKIEKEEYFLVREYGDNQKEVLRRPVDWDEFMREENYDEVIDKALEFYRDVLDYRYKYSGKF